MIVIVSQRQRKTGLAKLCLSKLSQRICIGPRAAVVRDYQKAMRALGYPSGAGPELPGAG